MITTPLQISIIIFDLDGTLVDSRIDISNSVNKMLKELNRPTLNNETIVSYVGDGVRKLIARCLNTTDRELVTQAQQIFLKDYEIHCLDNTKLYPGVIETLTHFSNKYLALVTNKPKYLTDKIIEGLQIRHFFKSVVGGDSTPYKKPKPDPIILALPKDFDISKNGNNILIVGDGRTDMEVARNLNVKSCFVKYGYESIERVKEFYPDFCISSIDELKKIC